MSETESPIDRIHAIIERGGLPSLTEAELGLFAIYWFVMETNNGGVHQFFFNDSGCLAMPALHYLEQIGATRTASVLRQAIALFPDANVPTDLLARRELLHAMEDRRESFHSLTDELFSCGEDVNEFHIRYARAHMELFSRIRHETAS